MGYDVEIPVDIQYVIEATIRFSDFVGIEDIVRMIEWAVISEEDMAHLASMYERIRKNSHWGQLHETIQEMGKSVQPATREMGVQVEGLLNLLCTLANKRVGAFYGVFARDTSLEDKFANPDWTKLPADLNYLARPAETYGLVLDQFGEGPIRDRLLSFQLEELSNLAERVRLHDGYSKVCDWLNELPMTENPEAVLVDALFGLLDELDYPFQ